MKSSARRFGLAVLLFSLAGCGLKGPLYLPDEKQQEVPATQPAPKPKPALDGSRILLPPAPQSQKKDRERSDQSPPVATPVTPPGIPPGPSQPLPVSPPDPDRPAATPPQAGQ